MTRTFLPTTETYRLAAYLTDDEPAALANVGVYVTRWYVSGRGVASWRFYNGPGD